MKRSILSFTVAALLAVSGAHAADAKAEADLAKKHAELEGRNAERGKLEADLTEARQRLEQAVKEVAALSAEMGRPVMTRLMDMGELPRRSIIGVQLEPAGSREGAKVREVSPGGPAAEAGILANDIIVAVNGAPVKADGAREVSQIIRRVEPESDVKIRVMRGGKPQDFVVIARPAAFMSFDGMNPPLPPMPPLPPGEMFTQAFEGTFGDLELANLSPELGKYFGSSEGVLVIHAPPESGLKLQDGDVILDIGGRKPTNGSHATRILRSYQPGEKVGMKVLRQKKALTLDVTLPEEEAFSRNRVFRTVEPQ